MTVAELMAALASLPDLGAPAVFVVDGRLVEVRALTHTTFEPRADVPLGVAVVRAETQA